MKIVYSGDTQPNKWMIEYAKDADVVIHEVMPMPESMVEFYNQPPERAIRASCGFHTCPPAFGKIMSELKPRHAIAFHWFNEEGTRYLQYDGIRETYDGPLIIASDLMAWNISKDEIVQREVIASERVQAPPTSEGYMKAKRSGEASYSEFVSSGKWKGYKPPPLPER